MDSSLVSRLENVANRMENILLKYDTANGSSSVVSLSHTGSSKPLAICNLDEELEGKLELLLKLSKEIGGDVESLGKMIAEMFTAHRNLVWMACGRQRPDTLEFQKLLGELSEKISAFATFKEKNRTSKFADHICAAEAAAGGLGWVAVEKTPVPYIADSVEMAVFYINRILKAYKGKEQKHFDWASTLKNVWGGLQCYVKKNHTTGLVWNSQPGAEPPVIGKSSVPPPPPPPLPSSVPVSTLLKPDPQEQILKALNTEDPTGRLKKVTADMQTHKNPALRAEHRDFVAVTPKTKSIPPKYDGKIFWDGKVWRVDYIVGNQDATVEVTETKESIYIYKCSNSVIKIKGKANAITLDSCFETAVVFDGLVAQCEIINSQKIQVQTLGELPTVSIQKTDGCHVFLSRAARNANIVASKSSEMNVSAQLSDGDDCYTELAIPEQFVTRIEGEKLVTAASEIV